MASSCENSNDMLKAEIRDNEGGLITNDRLYFALYEKGGQDMNGNGVCGERLYLESDTCIPPEYNNQMLLTGSNINYQTSQKEITGFFSTITAIRIFQFQQNRLI